MPLTDTGEDVVLNWLLAGAHISLHDGAATPDNEVGSGVNYTRIAYGPFTIVAGDPTSASNDNLIEFPTASGEWGLIAEFGIWTSATAGEMWVTGVIPTPKTVGEGDVVRFPPGTLVVTAR